MKVKVSVKASPKAQEKYYEQIIAEAYAEMEAMFQENKDLRLSESHLKDELNILRQQSEARRQIICERDKLIQELNDQIAATESELKHANEVIMSINEQLERTESSNVAYLDHIDSLEFDNAELTAECAHLRALATDYFEKWNALRQQDARTSAFAKALVSAIEKVSADDTAIVISEIE